ncbi:MAG: hypothetical protein ABFE01_29735, partial [Phycisphaerales bacterium]
RDFSIATVHLLVGIVLVLFGVIFGGYHWIQAQHLARFASAGTVMLAGLPVILGAQLLLNFLSMDMTNIPRDPLHRRLPGRRTTPVVPDLRRLDAAVAEEEALLEYRKSA